MRSTILRRIAIAVGLILPLGASQCAELPPPGGGYGGGYGVPPGTYQQTCADPFVTAANVLRADCRDRSGRFRQAALQLPCYGAIENVDGALICGRAADPVPQGSYQSSCRGAYVDRGTLVAECRARDGRWRTSSLALPCRRDILNDNGFLACGAAADPVPPGSYLDSCRNAFVERGTLNAECRTRSGRFRQSSLRLPCRDDITNEDGTLQCGRYIPPAPLPPGSYQSSCRDAFVERGVLFAMCRDRGGRFRDASLALPCRTDIANDNGALICGRPAPTPEPVPQGSYLSSCRNAFVERGILIAQCRDRGGRFRDASLALPCRYDITNADGALFCGRPAPTPAPLPEPLPRGSYEGSCRDAFVERGTLYAVCRTRSGRFRDSALPLPCRDDIANDDGTLVCGRIVRPDPLPDPRPEPRTDPTLPGDTPDPRAFVPPGSYLATCGNAYVTVSNVLVATCLLPDGRYAEAQLPLPCLQDIVNAAGRLSCGPDDQGN